MAEPRRKTRAEKAADREEKSKRLRFASTARKAAALARDCYVEDRKRLTAALQLIWRTSPATLPRRRKAMMKELRAAIASIKLSALRAGTAHFEQRVEHRSPPPLSTANQG